MRGGEEVEKKVERIYWQPDERIDRYVFHLVYLNGFWHIKKLVVSEEDFSQNVLNRREYYIIPTILDIKDAEDIDLKNLRYRTWIDKQELRWLAELVEELSNAPSRALTFGRL